MRLFVAVDIDDETRGQIAAATGAMRSALEGSDVPPRVTWVHSEAAHVTLRFIGDTPEATADRIVAALRRGFAMRPFDVRWERLGTFPGGRPRVIWLGPASAEALAALARDVNDRLEPIVGPPEPRPFAPHLTLGRVKESGRGVDWPQALSSRQWHATTTLVDHVTLYVSRLSSKGPTYTALCRAALAAA